MIGFGCIYFVLIFIACLILYVHMQCKLQASNYSYIWVWGLIPLEKGAKIICMCIYTCIHACSWLAPEPHPVDSSSSSIRDSPCGWGARTSTRTFSFSFWPPGEGSGCSVGVASVAASDGSSLELGFVVSNATVAYSCSVVHLCYNEN